MYFNSLLQKFPVMAGGGDIIYAILHEVPLVLSLADVCFIVLSDVVFSLVTLFCYCIGM